MHLQKLSLSNYKNIKRKIFCFEKKINCFVGDNGVGKTNVMDAIYHLSFAKSYFNSGSVNNIRHGEMFFMIKGDYILNEREERVICGFKIGQKKVLKRNGKFYDKISDHIGRFPLVIISPTDRDLISEGSEVRRRFIDSVISQQNKNYLKTLISYHKVLFQRNALLKYFYTNKTFNKDNLEVYNKQMANYGQIIYKERELFLKTFIPIFKERHNVISNSKEKVNLEYSSKLQEIDFLELLEKTLDKDMILKHTSVGIHRDDLLFEIDGHPIKKIGSQGQHKSYFISLKLAQFDFIKQQSSLTPILLLDDIFDKLDESRVSQLISLVNEDNFGQIFITDTYGKRTEKIVKRTNKSYKIFKLQEEFV